MPRPDVGWHHGSDIVAEAGAPIVAVADGELFQVGWNELGGQRASLRDDRGNGFYRLLAARRRLSPGSLGEALWSLGSGKAPPAAAVLLAAEDISTVVGLETEAPARPGARSAPRREPARPAARRAV